MAKAAVGPRSAFIALSRANPLEELRNCRAELAVAPDPSRSAVVRDGDAGRRHRHATCARRRRVVRPVVQPAGTALEQDPPEAIYDHDGCHAANTGGRFPPSPAALPERRAAPRAGPGRGSHAGPRLIRPTRSRNRTAGRPRLKSGQKRTRPGPGCVSLPSTDQVRSRISRSASPVAGCAAQWIPPTPTGLSQSLLPGCRSQGLPACAGRPPPVPRTHQPSARGTRPVRNRSARRRCSSGRSRRTGCR